MSKSEEESEIQWLDDVEKHDYAAAESYLLLVYDASTVSKLLSQLKSARLTQFKAKDIFRASQLSLLGISNSHVERDKKKIREKIPISPLLLVRDEKNTKAIIADGYHRLCAIYGFNEDAWINCKIV